MEPSLIAAQLVESGIITEAEKETYFTYGTEYSLDTPEDKATHDKVEKLVNEYDESKTPPVLSGQPKAEDLEYPDDKPKEPATNVPTPLDTHGGKDSDVSVSTAALRDFATNLKKLEDLVNTEHDSVKLVDIAPGTFGAGVYISTAIQKGLRGDTLRFLQSVGDTFTFIRADIETLIADYDSTEERSKMTVQQLNNLFNDAFSNVNNYSEYGNSSTDNIGGDKDEDGKGKGNGDGDDS